VPELESKMFHNVRERGPENGSKNHVWIKITALLAIVGGLTVFLYKSHLIHLFLDRQRLVHFLDSLGPWGFLGFIALQALQVVMAPIPGEATGLLGGFLYGPFIGVLLSTLGLTLGSFAAFALSRVFGRPFVERFVSKSTMERFDFLLHHKGAFLVFLLFLIPGFPKDYLCYMLGLGRLSTLEFIVIGGTGRLFGTVLLTLGGVYLRLHQYWRFFALLGAAVVVVFVTMAYRDKLEGWFKELHSRSQQKKDAKRSERMRDV
jgi:uncharacterized membrane protein YdjX (TVP38/TMEM64 family)